MRATVLNASVFCFLVCGALSGNRIGAQNWTQWGGPKRDFQVDAKSFPDEIKLNEIWRRDLGAGYSEAFTFLWRGDANTGAALAERLPFRGNAAARYTAALQELVNKGWATETNGEFTLTAEGTAVRQAIEQKTDDLFYAAWEDLSGADIQGLISLLNRLHGNMKDLVADKVAADRKDLWPLLVEVARGVYGQVRESVGVVVEELGLNRPFATLGLLTAQSTGTVSSAKLHQRAPYTHTQVIENSLHALAEIGLLRPGENGSAGVYHLTDKGRQTAQQYLDSFWETAAALTPIPEDDLTKIADLMGRVVTAGTAIKEATNLHIMQAVPIAAEAVAMIRIDYYMDCLNAFRDDVHLTPFHSHKISGQAWEALTMIWREQADTAVTLAEKLKSRGFTEADYAEAVDKLVQKGWVTEADGRYVLTEEGTNVREQAEILTDRAFYAPWTTLNQQETTELRDLLKKLADSLKEPALA
jgi:predicted transcriptional regulator